MSRRYCKKGTCEFCFFGYDLWANREDPECHYHKGRKIKRGERCNQFMRADWANPKQ